MSATTQAHTLQEYLDQAAPMLMEIPGLPAVLPVGRGIALQGISPRAAARSRLISFSAEAGRNGSEPSGASTLSELSVNEYIPVSFEICATNISRILFAFSAVQSPASRSSTILRPSWLTALIFSEYVCLHSRFDRLGDRPFSVTGQESSVTGPIFSVNVRHHSVTDPVVVTGTTMTEISTDTGILLTGRSEFSSFSNALL